MESKLTQALSYITLIAAWAYSLGWLKSFYYFRSFGIGLESVDFSVQDYLFASWYVIENVMFFVLLLWIAAITQRIWVCITAALYLPLPFLTDWSYSHLNSPTLGWLFALLIGIPHSILKFSPFLVLLVVIVVHKDTHARFKESSWPHGKFWLVVVSIIAIAWSISAAKHFGTSDANSVLSNPSKSLLRVKLRTSEGVPSLKSIEARQSLYLLYYGPHRCVLLDTVNFAFGQPGAHVTIVYVPSEKVDMVEGLREVQLDPGRLFW